MPEELAFRSVVREARHWKPRRRRLAKVHPGVQRNLRVASSPHLLQAPVRLDSAHQVIVAARATNQTSDKQQAAAMMEETIEAVQSPGKYPPMLAITRRRQSTSFMLWAWTRSSRRADPPRPSCATRAPRSTQPQGPDATEITDQQGLRRMQKFGQSRAGDQFLLRLEKVNGSPAQATTCSNCSALGYLHRKTRRWASPTHQELPR